MLALVVALAAAAAAGADAVVAQVDGEAITASRFQARLAMMKAQANPTLPAAALDRLVDETLMAAEARRLGLHQAPAVTEAIENERRRLASDLLVRDLATLQPEEAQLEAMYHAGSDVASVRQILFLSREEAQASLDRLRQGAAFAEEARRSVDARTRDQGGALGKRNRQELDPALAGPAFEVPLKVPLGPIALGTGFAVIEVLERTIADEAGFAGVREPLRGFAAAQLQKQARAHLVEQLRRKSPVTLDEAFLQKMGSRLEASGDEAGHVVAKVGGRPLRYEEVLEDVRSLSRGQASAHSSGSRIKIDLAQARVEKLLLQDEAIARGLGNAAEIQPALWQYQQAVLSHELELRARAAVRAPAPAEVEAFHRQHAADYAQPARRACAHLLLETRGEAQAARKRIQKGEKFEDVARGASIDKASAAQGGAIGEVGEDQLDAAIAAGRDVDLARALKETPAGQVSEPVQSALGFHLLRCGARIPPQARPLAEVREAVGRRLAEERGEQAVAAEVVRLRGAARLRVDREAAERAAASGRS